MISILGVILGILAFAISSVVVRQLIASSQPTLAETLRTTAAQVNEETPVMVDNETRLDSVSAESNDTLKYQYTLVNVTAEEIDSTELKSQLEPQVIATLKSNKEMDAFRKNKVTLVYSYKDKVDQQLLISN